MNLLCIKIFVSESDLLLSKQTNKQKKTQTNEKQACPDLEQKKCKKSLESLVTPKMGQPKKGCWDDIKTTKEPTWMRFSPAKDGGSRHISVDARLCGLKHWICLNSWVHNDTENNTNLSMVPLEDVASGKLNRMKYLPWLSWIIRKSPKSQVMNEGEFL